MVAKYTLTNANFLIEIYHWKNALKLKQTHKNNIVEFSYLYSFNESIR